jgi:hypothetical protein
MNKNKKLIGAVLLVAGGIAGCATAPARLVSRGMVASTTSGTWAIVAGPRTVHAYAGDAGGEIYNAPATTGTNADCTRANPAGLSVPVPADKVVSVAVSAGEVACLRTTADRGYELLWHAVEQARAPEVIVANASDRNGVRQ